MLKIDSLKIDAGTQPRVKMSEEAIERYKEFLVENPDENMLPIQVAHTDEDGDYIPWDGFQRIEAYRRAGRRMIPAEVTRSSLRQAQECSLGANRSHGLPMNEDDKRSVLAKIFADSEWSQWGTNEIHKRTGISRRFIESYRASCARAQDAPGETRKVVRNGKGYDMKVSHRCAHTSESDNSNDDKDVTENGEHDADDDAPPVQVKEYADSLGNHYPPQASDAMRQVPELTSLQQRVNDLEHEVNRIKALPIGQYLDDRGVLTQLKQIHGAFSLAKPYRVCPTCKGQPNEQAECKSCSGSGWVNRMRYGAIGDSWGDR